MLVYCTYCSAKKNHSKKLLKAIELYNSSRITTVYNLAKAKGLSFVILSGKYGILDTEQVIANYDHLLLAREVETHAAILVAQLKEKKISQIVFYMNLMEQDKNLRPYLDCIKLASDKSGVKLEIKEMLFKD